jgi:hypothetical protein
METPIPEKRKPLTPLQRAKMFSMTKARFFELMIYDRDAGKLYWREGSGRRVVGAEAGSLDGHGYRQISIDAKMYLVHRIIWWLENDQWPIGDVDHADGDHTNNNVNNLRLASRSQNCANSKLRKDSSLGLKGVSRHGKRFRAQIQVLGKKKLLGIYDTAEAAHAAYVDYAKKHFGLFARAA